MAFPPLREAEDLGLGQLLPNQLPNPTPEKSSHLDICLSLDHFDSKDVDSPMIMHPEAILY